MCLAVNNDSSQERYNYTKNFLKTDSFDNHAIAKLGGKCLKIFEEKFSRSKDGTLDQPNKDFEDRDAYLDYATIASLPVLAADAAHLYLWAMPDRDDGWRLILYHDMELGVKCDYLTLEQTLQEIVKFLGEVDVNTFGNEIQVLGKQAVALQMKLNGAFTTRLLTKDIAGPILNAHRVNSDEKVQKIPSLLADISTETRANPASSSHSLAASATSTLSSPTVEMPNPSLSGKVSHLFRSLSNRKKIVKS
ncbi:hypothetical protein BT96DRAFT_1022123 [Gymnopus androsaceus JB14]|uniref:Uncharacterized protein n=1 Tax=Gymnopus androsaceus JB14 TaxID=1447944 RepID=A0A6A4HD32_9AGAR|nr:hypothetical protein BT96DRAFT_1022123 [Gymnopus androsaceus JB14]